MGVVSMQARAGRSVGAEAEEAERARQGVPNRHCPEALEEGAQQGGSGGRSQKQKESWGRLGG